MFASRQQTALLAGASVTGPRGSTAARARSTARRPVRVSAVATEQIGKIRFDEVAAIDHKEGETHVVGSVGMSRVDYPDGTRVVRIKCEGLGDGLQLHWGCVLESADEWSPPPQGTNSSGGINGAGDGIASRTNIGGASGATITFPPGVGEKIERIVGMVVKKNEPEDLWLHATVGDLVIPLTTPSATNVLKALSEGEASKSGSLYERFVRVNDTLGQATRAGPDGAAAVMATLRLSAIRQLPWYGGGNYQGTEMAGIQETVASRVADACKSAESGMARQLFRVALSTLPRGGGNGDDIRLGILQIMRDNGIKEGRQGQGIEDEFLQQWHQKLHSNTTVDDIYICEAYLHFLHTGNWDDFWTHLWENHQLTRDDLAAMKAGWRTDGILGPGNHLPQLINPMKHFYWILRVTHGGGNMDSAMDFARGKMDGDVEGEIHDLLANRDEGWAVNKIVELRERMSGSWRYGDVTERDVVLLDIAMEKFYRQKIEGLDLTGWDYDARLGQLEMSIRNVLVGQDFDRLISAYEFFRKANGDSGLTRWTPEWAKVMDAALESVSLAMEYHMDDLCQLVQHPADVIGEQADCDQAYIMNFGEEVVRGHSMFAVSRMLSESRPGVREAAGRSPWDVAALGSPQLASYAGEVTVTELADIQGGDYSAAPVVILSARLGGLEDIPPGVTAVLTSAPVDLLSHIAIRARQTGVLLAAMPDPAGWEALVARAGQGVKIEVVGEEIKVSESELGPAAASSAAGAPAAAPKLTLTPKADTADWVVTPDKYAEGVVGGKSSSLAKLGVSPALASFGRVPASSALPFNAFEKALAADSATAAKVTAAAAAIATADAAGDANARRAALDTMRSTIAYELKMPDDLVTPLTTAAAAYGNTCAPADIYQAVKKVWASKWNERAFLSRKACGVEEDSLHMATLLMEVVPAENAFVLHTANPLTGDTNEVFGEVCVGLGEALVGNEPGSALSFTAAKTAGAAPAVRSLPSKPIAHHAPYTTMIVRSDSNGEDLEGFAGAGLYDSVTVVPTEERLVNYADEPLIWDEPKRTALISRLAQLAVAIEAEMGVPQDIEGCIVGDDIYVLQSRNQVL
mmetsp:Transcript_7326/g.32321  ORF Transcript_7326/g.32321 Transcript_7326/m.32321 type:complete len:1089 (+) Transcript_7326:185-3451(+)